jgi:hypothetical protein
VKDIRAKAAYDYKSSTVLEDLKKEGPFKAIFDTSGAAASFQVIAQLFPAEGGSFASVLPDVSNVLPPHVEVKFMTFSELTFKPENKEFLDWLFGDYLETQVLNGTYAPQRAGVRPGGLHGIQAAMDELLHGVEAQKLVLNP